MYHWVNKSKEEKAMSHHLNVRASIPPKVCPGNFRQVIKRINAKRNQQARNTRRCAALLLILSILILSVPPVVAGELAKETAVRSIKLISSAQEKVDWLRSLLRWRGGAPQQNKGMPQAPVNPPPVRPQRSRSKAEHEARASSIRLNTSDDVLLQSRERML